MCFVKQPEIKPATSLTPRTEVVSKEDTTAITAQAEKERKGYASTFAADNTANSLFGSTVNDTKKNALGA